MKRYFFLLAFFICMASCNIQKEVEKASAECKAMMSSVIQEIESLQDDICLTKEDLIQFLQTRIESSNNFESCDTISYD